MRKDREMNTLTRALRHFWAKDEQAPSFD
ncbi:unknown protein [Waddlia chondrophila 2032/99]|uniref:Uncharacterized protein n=1 Tax=Waddlia chondrophila 2032/99 TaxID=765953 RepID=F8LEH3_9BACT|nr:unknown protein [Waddlia chondrophila 2032/99]